MCRLSPTIRICERSCGGNRLYLGAADFLDRLVEEFCTESDETDGNGHHSRENARANDCDDRERPAQRIDGPGRNDDEERNGPKASLAGGSPHFRPRGRDRSAVRAGVKVGETPGTG